MKIYDSTGLQILDIEVDDSSYRYRAIMGEDQLTLHFSLAEHVEIPVGSSCEFMGTTYTLARPEALKMRHSRLFEYTVLMDAVQAKAGMWKFRNPVDGRLKFTLTAKPQEHLQMFIDNMNRRDSGWTAGDCTEGPETTVNYDHNFCSEALQMMADTFKTEFEFNGKEVSLHKVEYGKDNPLPLSYGNGNGFLPGVGRANYGDTVPIEILFVQGGERNIDSGRYGHKELLLPPNQTIGYDGTHFEDEPGYRQASSRTYRTDAEGLSLMRNDRQPTSLAEGSLDCSDIYPKRIGTVTEVITVSAAEHKYDFTDESIPQALDYTQYRIGDETMTVIFQTGMLAGKEFEVRYIHSTRRFEIRSEDIDGRTMPDETFKPRSGDTYAVFHCTLPDEYICDSTTKTGASWDMFRSAVKYLYENEEQHFTFSGELDGQWAAQDWVNISGRLVLGGYISFKDERFQPEPKLLRITGIKTYVNRPYSPQIELSNHVQASGFTTGLKRIENREAEQEELHKEAIRYTKRRYRDTAESIEMLEQALLAGYTERITPIAVQTMTMLVGDESLQFRFVNSALDPTPVEHEVFYGDMDKSLFCDSGTIQHMTLGIDSIGPQHDDAQCRFWNIPQKKFYLDREDEKYYLYAKVDRLGDAGEFILSTMAIAMEAEQDHYHLLLGLLNSEFEGTRSYVSLYGFTEILPGRITTDKVVSADGQSFFNLAANAIQLGDRLSFNTSGDGKLRLNGTLVQSGSGMESPIGCFRGAYDSINTYYDGDEVTDTVNGLKSTYRYINPVPKKGIPVTNTAYWQVLAEGSKGDPGRDGADGQDGLPGQDGQDGTPGQDGKDGIDGKYTELRFREHSDPNSPPPLDRAALIPPGWSTAQPEARTGWYVWFTSAVKNADGTFADGVQWGPPSRTTGADGKDGQDGADGQDGKSPAMVYLDAYDPGKTYYGNEFRLDCVEYGGEYYIAKIDAGAFHGIAPGGTANPKWNYFGATFESVATKLLLAENANIAGMVFRNGRMESQNGKVLIDGNRNMIGIQDEDGYMNVHITDGSVAQTGPVRERTGFQLPEDIFDNKQLDVYPDPGSSTGKYILEYDDPDQVTAWALLGDLKEGDRFTLQNFTGKIDIPSIFNTYYAMEVQIEDVEIEITIELSCDGNPVETARFINRITGASTSSPAEITSGTFTKIIGKSAGYGPGIYRMRLGVHGTGQGHRSEHGEPDCFDPSGRPYPASSTGNMRMLVGQGSGVDPKHRTAIGTDGLVSMYDMDHYAIITVNDKVEISVGGYGLQIKEDGVKIKKNGEWTAL